MPETQAQAFELFHSRLESVASDWNDRRREYMDNYRQLMGKDISGGSPKPWGAKVNSRHTYAQVDTHVAFLQAGLMPTFPWVFAEMPEPWRDLAPRAQEEYNRRLRDAGFYRFLYRWLRLADTMKLGVAKMGFGPSGPQWNLVHPGNFMWDPSAESLRNDAEWVLEFLKRQSKRMVEADWKAGLYTCSPEEFKRVMDYSDSERTAQDEERMERTSNVPEFDGDDHHLSFYWMVEPERILKVHEPSKVVLMDIPNELGYINYYDLTTFMEPFDIEGYGIPDLSRDLQDEINTLRRQRIDIRSLVANPMFKLLKGSGLDPFQLVSAPGAVYSVNNSDDLSMLQVQDFSGTLQSEEGLLVGDFDRVIGVQGQTRGEPGKAGMKATVANIIHSNVNVRMGVTMNLIQDYPLRAFLADYVNLSALVETPSAITMQEWELVRERAEAGEVWLVPHSEAYVGNAVEKFNLLFQLLQGIAPITAPPGIAELAKEMISLVQIRDPERITQYIVGNVNPDPVAPPQLPGPNTQGQGIPMVEEQARAGAPMQAGNPMSEAIPG